MRITNIGACIKEKTGRKHGEKVMVFDEKQMLIEQKIRELSYQPLSEMTLGVDYVSEKNETEGEVKEDVQPKKSFGERLDGYYLECAECGKHFHIQYGQFQNYLWKRQKQKNLKKTMLYFCTYTHMKQWQRKQKRE